MVSPSLFFKVTGEIFPAFASIYNNSISSLNGSGPVRSQSYHLFLITMQVFSTRFLFVTNTKSEKHVFAKVIITALMGTAYPQEYAADYAS